MEIFTTPSAGAILIAPRGGDAHWSYTLTSLVQPGDVVYHYQSTGANRGSIVGWSTASEPARAIPSYTWQARGTSGRSRGIPTTGPGWEVRLGGMNPLSPVISKARLLSLLDPLLAVNDDLKRRIGKPTYFPWYRYGGNQLRAQQGYLTKFPAELFDVLPELATVQATVNVGDSENDELEEDAQPSNRKAPHGRVTRVHDPVLRAAIERRSLDVTLAHYDALGATDSEELGKPYDIRLMLDRVERHIEVKGSSIVIDTVELTANEVTHAQGYESTDLAVVDSIEWTRESDGSISTRGGRLRTWSDWTPTDESLLPTKFAYSLPDTDPTPYQTH